MTIGEVLSVEGRASISGHGQESVQRRALGRGQVQRFQQLPEAAATAGHPGGHFFQHVCQREGQQGQTQRFQHTRQHGSATGSAECFAGAAFFVFGRWQRPAESVRTR